MLKLYRVNQYFVNKLLEMILYVKLKMKVPTNIGKNALFYDFCLCFLYEKLKADISNRNKIAVLWFNNNKE